MRGTSTNDQRGKSGAPLKVTTPTIGKVTHHNAEVVMTREDNTSVDPKNRVAVTLQQQDKHGGWFTIYTLVSAGIFLSLLPNICLAYTRVHTMYVIQCTSYNVRDTMYLIQCTSYNIRHTMYVIQCTAYNVRHIMYVIQCTSYNIRQSMYVI